MPENLDKLQQELKIAKLKVDEETYRINAQKQLDLADRARENWEALVNGPAPVDKSKSRKVAAAKASKTPKSGDSFNPAATK
jgi:hypothetical protein